MHKHNFFEMIHCLRQKQYLDSGTSNANTSHASKESVNMRPQGNLKIEAIYPDGTTKKLVDEKNMVVKQAETIMPFMSLAQRSFNYIELGDPSPATAPAETDTVLQQTTAQRKAVTATVTTNSVSMEALWLTSEGNGYDYTEAGLFTDPFGTGLMFARKTFAPITKTASFAIKFTWTIIFQIQSSSSNGCNGVAVINQTSVTSDYVYTAVGGETEVIVPMTFVPGNKELDVFLNGVRLVYNVNYYESLISGTSNGIKLMGFALLTNDILYFVQRKVQ